jgi:two-component system, LuxR family, response regulator FixJ
VQPRIGTARALRNVLLVDDDSLERTALARLLRGAGYYVTAFERPSDVLVTLLPKDNTCLVLDIYMPEMTGVSLWKELRNEGFEVPTILITGHRDQQTAAYGEQVNAVAILYKPIEEKDLFVAIERALGSGRT